MYNTSIIQQMRDNDYKLYTYKCGVKDFLEKFDTDGIVFIFNEGRLYEADNGYLDVLNTYKTLDEAFDNMKLNNLIFITKENEDYVYKVGNYKQILSECLQNEVVHINTLKQIK